MPVNPCDCNFKICYCITNGVTTPGLADWGPRGGDSNSPDSPAGRGKSRNVTL